MPRAKQAESSGLGISRGAQSRPSGCIPRQEESSKLKTRRGAQPRSGDYTKPNI